MGILIPISPATHPRISLPFVLAAPGIFNRRIKDLVQSIDIYPTILGLVGIKPPSWVQGIDLVPLILEKPAASRNQYLVSEHRGGVIRSIRSLRWKLYFYQNSPEKNELYDLLLDPQEQNNVINQHPEVVKQLSQALYNILLKSPTFPRPETKFPDWIDEKKRQEIIEEGYF